MDVKGDCSGLRRAFVVGAFAPDDESYMLYHLGAILHEVFDVQCLVLTVGEETSDHAMFSYPHPFSSLPLEVMSALATSGDILIANDGSSKYLLGLGFPGTKVSYIQRRNPHPVLDCFFDHYVACSSSVHDSVRLHYRIDPPVIPPFVHADFVREPTPWDAREPRGVLVIGGAHTRAFLRETTARLRAGHGDLLVDFHTLDGRVSHGELLQRMQRHRYVLSLVAGEGGLMPLAAMLSGCTVVSFHAHGREDYMESGRNCEAVAYPDFDLLVDGFARLIRDDAYARGLAELGRQTALQYGLEAFRARWVSFFHEVVGITRASSRDSTPS